MRFALHDIELALPGAGIERDFSICSENSTQSQRMAPAVHGKPRLKIVMYADDIMVVAESKEDIQVMMDVIAGKFANFGLKLAENKTETMTWNTSSEIMEEEFLIKVNDKNLKNVREFRYLGHKLTDESKPKFLTAQIRLAYAAWNEHKKFLTDQRVKLWIRIQFAESIVRSRLTYALQTDRLKPHERAKIDSIWIRICRKMIKGVLGGLDRPTKATNCSSKTMML